MVETSVENPDDLVNIEETEELVEYDDSEKETAELVNTDDRVGANCEYECEQCKIKSSKIVQLQKKFIN